MTYSHLETSSGPSIRASLLVAFLGCAAPVAAQDLLQNGGFEQGLTGWSTSDGQGSGYSVQFGTTTDAAVGTNAARMTWLGGPTPAQPWKVQLKQSGFATSEGERYRARFQLRAAVQDAPVTVCLQKNSSPWNVYDAFTFAVPTDWEEIEFAFTAQSSTANDLRFVFWLGAAESTVDVDGVELEWLPQALDPDNDADWTQSGIQGEIPLRPMDLDVTAFGAVGDGLTDDTQAFQAALDQAEPNTAVWAPNGTYLLTGSLHIPDHVTLCGDSPSGTVLRFDFGGNATIALPIARWDRGAWIDVLEAPQRGDTSIRVQDPSAFTVGQHLQLLEENDPGAMYTRPEWQADWAEESVGEVAKVVGIDGDQLQLERAIEHDYEFWRGPSARRFRAIEGVGVENLKLERACAGVAATILMKHASGCFVRNVELDHTVVAHVWMSISEGCELRSSYLHHSFDYGGGGRGYGVVCGEHTSRCRVEDNVFDTLRHAMMVKEGAVANVFAFNHSTNPIWTGAGNPADISLHGHWPSRNLFEGNVCQHPVNSDSWGPSGPGNTLFRNRVESLPYEILDHSAHQAAVANEFSGGGIWSQWSVFDIRAHSNELSSGVDQAWPGLLPDSLLYGAAPEFWGNTQWPAYGPDVVSADIPARQRFIAGTEIVVPLPRVEPNDPGLARLDLNELPDGIAEASTDRSERWRRRLRRLLAQRQRLQLQVQRWIAKDDSSTVLKQRPGERFEEYLVRVGKAQDRQDVRPSARRVQRLTRRARMLWKSRR